MKLTLSDQAIRRIASFAKKANSPLDKVVYASDDEGYYRVNYSRGNALADLQTVDPDETWVDIGDKLRVPPNDLLEFYTLYDIDHNVISDPDQYNYEE